MAMGWYHTTARRIGSVSAEAVRAYSQTIRVCSRQTKTHLGGWLQRQIPNTLLVWSQRQKRSHLWIAGGLAFSAAAYLGAHLETLPYSSKARLVLLPRCVDKMVRGFAFEAYMEGHLGVILSETHPATKRVTLIAEKLIDAYERASRDRKAWKSPNYALSLYKEALRGKNEFEWKVLVVVSPEIEPFSAPHGLIAVTTGLLQRCKSDDEIAAIIGREIALVVGRHKIQVYAKGMTALDILKLYWNKFDMSCFCGILDTHEGAASLAFLRKLVSEADKVGMYLMDSAGYDPNAKLAMLQDGKRWSLTRAQQEAMALYGKNLSTQVYWNK